MYHRDYLKRQSVRFTSSTYNEAYKRCKNKLNKLIKMTKEEYFKTKLSNANNSKNSWQAINELLNKKPKSTKVTQLNVDDQVITGDRNIADCFNQYFSSIGCKLSESIQNINIEPMAFVTPVESSFHFSRISVQEVLSALNQLNLRKSPGLHGISVKLLKDTSDVIAQPLANIFNLSLQTGIFPDDWKIAKISPVFKEGNKTDCGNYRPISVISVVAKLFEGLVYNQLRTFISDNNILVKQQSGFRSQHSTETALLGDNDIKRVTSKKSLGFIIDDQLKWGMHIDAQCKKISKGIALLRRAKSFVPLHILNNMYNALVLPHMTYCSTIWNDGSNTILKKLSELQKRAARVITGQSYEVCSTQILESLNWIPIEDTLKNRETTMTFKALTNRLPDFIHVMSCDQLAMICYF